MPSVAKWEREADRNGYADATNRRRLQERMTERSTTKKLTRSEFKSQESQDSKRRAQSSFEPVLYLPRPEMGAGVLPLRTFPG